MMSPARYTDGIPYNPHTSPTNITHIKVIRRGRKIPSASFVCYAANLEHHKTLSTFFPVVPCRTGERTRLVIEPYTKGWNLGRSLTETLTRNGVPVGTVYEPRSASRYFGLNVGIQWFI